MSDELKEKISKLPSWARAHIKKLEELGSPNQSEITRLQQKTLSLEKRVRLLQDRCDMMIDIFQAASRGGNETAAEFVNRVYSIWTHEEE